MAYLLIVDFRYTSHSVDLTKRLLSKGADPNARNPLDITPLSYAVEFGSRAVIELLLASGGDLFRGQLLHFAARRMLPDRLEVAESLLRRGLNPSAMKFDNHQWSYLHEKPFCLGTPLTDAAFFQTKDTAKLLLFWGADPQIKDTLGKAPWEVAASKSNIPMTHLLRFPPSRTRLWFWYIGIRAQRILNRFIALFTGGLSGRPRL